MSDCWYDVLFMKCCLRFMPDITWHKPSKKQKLSLLGPQNIFPQNLWDHQDIFGQM